MIAINYSRIDWVLERARANSLLLGALVIGVAIRITFAVADTPPSFDEVVTLQLAQIPLGDSWRYVSLDNIPPLYTWLLHIWGTLFGFSTVSARLFSTLLAIPAVYPVYLLGVAFGGKGLGRWTLVVFALAPFAIYHASVIRAYAPLFLLSATSLLIFWRLLWEPSRRRALLFAATTVGLLYSGSVGLGLLTAQVVFLFIKSGGRSAPGKRLALLGGTTGALLFIPWLVASASAAAHSPAAALIDSGWYFGSQTATPIVLLAPFGLIFNAVSLYWSRAVVALASIGAVVAIILGLSLLWRDSSRRPTALYISLVMTLPLVTWSLLFSTIPFRYFIPSAIAVYLAVAVGLRRLNELAGRIRYRRALLAVLGIIFTAVAIFNGHPGGSPRGFAEWLQSSPARATLSDPAALVLTYVGLEPSRLRVIYPPSVATPSRGESDDLYNLIAFNWSSPYYRVSGVEFPAFRKRVSSAANGDVAVNVMLMHDFSKSIKLALEDLGYRCVDYYPRAGSGSYVVHMELGLERASDACRARGL